jgi:hypothetical protein
MPCDLLLCNSRPGLLRWAGASCCSAVAVASCLDSGWWMVDASNSIQPLPEPGRARQSWKLRQSVLACRALSGLGRLDVAGRWRLAAGGGRLERRPQRAPGLPYLSQVLSQATGRTWWCAVAWARLGRLWPLWRDPAVCRILAGGFKELTSLSPVPKPRLL